MCGVGVMIEWISQHWEAIVGISSAVIALASLFISFWSAHLTRKHNQLSVMPRLDSHAVHDQSLGSHKYFLQNKGIGPAIIRKVDVVLDARKINESLEDSIHIIVRELVPRIENNSLITGGIGKGSVLAPGDEICLLGFVTEEKTRDSYDRVMENFPRANVEIEYESFYGKVFKLE